jgi:hypothetical protein
LSGRFRRGQAGFNLGGRAERVEFVLARGRALAQTEEMIGERPAIRAVCVLLDSDIPVAPRGSDCTCKRVRGATEIRLNATCSISQNGADKGRTGARQIAQKAPRVGCSFCIENANEYPPCRPPSGRCKASPAGQRINSHAEIAAAALIRHSPTRWGKYFTSMQSYRNGFLHRGERRLQRVRRVAAVVNAVAVTPLIHRVLGRADRSDRAHAGSSLDRIAALTFGVVVACL